MKPQEMTGPLETGGEMPVASIMAGAVAPFIAGPDTAELSHDIGDYPGGIIIPIDKPYRWTSADVIRKVKFAACRHFGKKNLKVGHAGTLDPLATGVLLVCIGNATKMAESLQAHDKEYVAGITFGATTPSYDLEKEIDRFSPYGHITQDSVSEALRQFVGEQDQIAPLFSAKSVDGVRAYELARKLFKEAGKEASDNAAGEDCTFDQTAKELIRSSRICISSLELLSFIRSSSDAAGPACPEKTETAQQDPETGQNGQHGQHGQSGQSGLQNGKVSKASSRINVTDNSSLGLPHATIRMACSKGTYVRAFARDLGEALGSGAHLDSLQRSRSGDFSIENSITVDRAISLLTPRQD